MSRWVSLIVLLVVIAITVVVLYRVMAGFLLPLFLAAVLAVIFRPLHQRIVDRMPRRPAVAAVVTTGLILLTVLLPLFGVATLAVREGLHAVGGDVLDRAEVRLDRFRDKVGLGLPLRELPNQTDTNTLSLADVDRMIESLPPTLPTAATADPSFVQLIDHLDDGLQRLNRRLDNMLYLVKEDAPSEEESLDMKRVRRMQASFGDRPVESMREVQSTVGTVKRYLQEGPSALAEIGEDPPMSFDDLSRRFARVPARFAGFRIDLTGGPFRAWLTDVVNPSATKIDSLRANVQRWLRGLLPSVAGQATALVGSSLLGLAIMSLAVFYFLKDGPSIVQTLMRLSPLDDRYEEELVAEFESVSRAVVLATLLSAVAQGLLASVAFLLAGFDSIFLLTGLTMVFAMIPFVGAAAIWLPACVWLAMVEERWVAALVLLAYGAIIISMADNVIKPLVLHGQSKLHPLLALLSVLGGVQALGPIGILVGPMVVSFLQALLNILQQELQTLDNSSVSAANG